MTRISQLLISILLVLIASHSYSQSIVAGATPPQGTYIDLVPDTVLISVQNYLNTHYTVDLNNDNNSDFIISTNNCGGMGGGGSSIRIESYNNNEVAYSHVYSCTAGPYNHLIGTSIMAKAYNNNDTISINDLWTNDPCFLKTYSHGFYQDSLGATQHYNCSSGNFSSLSQFVGIRTISNDTTYGWIQVKDISAYGATIQAYASNQYSTGISDNKEYVPIQVYPNPCKQILNVSLDRLTNYSGTIEIYNNLGVLKLQEPYLESKLKIDVQNLQNGMYILVLKTSDRIFHAKFQILN
jgi:hypothetical protein